MLCESRLFYHCHVPGRQCTSLRYRPVGTIINKKFDNDVRVRDRQYWSTVTQTMHFGKIVPTGRENRTEDGR